MTEISIVEVPDMTVMGTRKTGTYRLIPGLLMKVFSPIRKKKIALAGPPIFVCHEISPEAVREANEKGTAVLEVAWPFAGKVKGTKEIPAYVLPGGPDGSCGAQGSLRDLRINVPGPLCLDRIPGADDLRPDPGSVSQRFPSVPPEDIVTGISMPVR